MNEPHGVCKNCQYWEPAADLPGSGFCPIFNKETTALHGAACSAWEQIPPPGLLERRESEMSEAARWEATGGTRLMGEIGLVMIVAGIVVFILLVLYCNSSLYLPVAP